MTDRTVKARLCWVTKAEGGRDKLPTSATFTAPARFENERDKFPREAWSLVVYLSPPDESHCMIATVRFLNPSGPKRLLHAGSLFELFDGPNVVATGEIL